MYYKIALVAFLIFTVSGIRAQDISGVVKDEKTGAHIPFANIWYKGTNVGTISDVNGLFKLKASGNEVICISSVGYVLKEIPASEFSDDFFTVKMEMDVREIREVKVRPETSRAKELFRQVLRNKRENREKLLSVDDYKSLARTTVYVALDSASKVNRFVDNLDEVTMKLDNKSLRFSPIYLSELAKQNSGEKDSTVYEKKDGIFPKLNQTIESLILLNVVVDMDFYKDQIYILGRGITSPLSSTARIFYDIYLNDSTQIDNTWYYSFSFVPKNKYGALFTGGFTVEGDNFALTRIYAYVQEEANINFVNGFKSRVVYRKPEGEDFWFYKEQEIGLNLSLFMNKDTVSKYDSQRIDEISGGNWMVNKTTLYSTSDRLNTVKTRDWKDQPEFAYNQLDEGNYKRVELLKENSVVRGIDAIGGAVLTSYINAGKIDIGPVFDIYSTNAIEGHRFSIPLRTGEEMFERFTVGGFLGFGTRSSGIKYGMNMAWQIRSDDKYILRLDYSDDYKLVSQDKYLKFIKKNPNTRGNGNFIAAVTSRVKNPYLKEEKSYKFIFEYNADANITVESSLYYHRINSTPAVRFVRDGTDYAHYGNYGLLFNCRLAFGQYYDKYYFTRVYYIDQIPVVNLSVDMGQVHLPGEKGTNLGFYSQFHGSIVGRVNIGQTFTRYMANGGILFGRAPFDLLDQPVGSMSLGYAKYRYNLLHQAAFAHNLYSNIHIDFNGGGIILNRIPLLKRLKLREMVSLKSHVGIRNDSYIGVFELPEYNAHKLTAPYAEIGLGLTNIFRVLRLEYVHLLGNTYVNSGFADKHGFRFRAEMSF